MDLFQYLEGELRTFDQLELTPVDSAAISQMSMIDAPAVVPALRRTDVARLRRVGGIDAAGACMPGEETTFMGRLSDAADAVADRLYSRTVRGAHASDLLAAELYDSMFTGLDHDNIKRQIASFAASPRFRELEMRDYAALLDQERRVQFSATCYVMPGDWAYVAFRGTDTSFTGWRENFDMAVTPPVPAQRMAAAYLELVARHLPQRLYMGGHSKGGNLATYAAVRCSDAVRARIACVFDHDGPGFKAGFLSDEPALAALRALEGRIHRTVPVDSVVGMIMNEVAPARAVRSSAYGMDQHSMFSWEIDGDDFVYEEGVSAGAKGTHEVLGTWLASFSDEELPGVVDALFSAMAVSGAQNAGQIFGGGPQAAQYIHEAIRKSDERTREVLGPALAKLAQIAAERIARGAVAGIAQGFASLFNR